MAEASLGKKSGSKLPHSKKRRDESQIAGKMPALHALGRLLVA
jgi:hypothetical protein